MLTNAPPFFFAIPLKARRVSKDWGLVSANLHRTLLNLAAQSDQYFHIVLALHDRPDFLTQFAPSNLTILDCSQMFDPPESVERFGMDKSRKKRVIGVHLKRSVKMHAYIMHMDADDLLHRDLVKTVYRGNNRRGYLISRGYMVDVNSGDVAVLDESTKPFYSHCGSCAVLYVKRD